jgi:ABC-type polysaccharide/polyol phosphate export permease
VLANLVHFLLGLPIIVVFLVWAGRLRPSILLLPLPVLVQLVFTVGLALFFSALTVHFRDLQDILSHLLHLWFWGSPILYFYGGTTGAVRKALRLNPLSHVIVSYQQMLFAGHFDHWKGLALAGVAALVMLVLGLFLFDRLRDTLAEEV